MPLQQSCFRHLSLKEEARLTILGLHASQNENNIVKDKKQVSDFYYLPLIKGKQSHTKRERKKYDLIVHPKTSNYDVLAKLQFLNF